MAKQIKEAPPLGAKEKERVVSEFAKYLEVAKQQKLQAALKLLRKPKVTK